MTFRRISLLSIAVLAVVAFAAACAAPAPEGDCLAPGPDGTLVPAPCPTNGDVPTPTPPPANGAPNAGVQTFRTAGCVACHAIQGVSTSTTGPGLDGIGARAAERVPGLSAEQYLRQAIVDPRAYIVEGYPPIMPDNYEQTLTAEQIDTLVEYLHSLR